MDSNVASEALSALQDEDLLVYPEKTVQPAATEPQRIVMRTFEVDLCFRSHRLIYQFHPIFPTTVDFWENVFPSTLEEIAKIHYHDHPLEDLVAVRSVLKSIDSWYFHVDHEVGDGKEPEQRAILFLQILDSSLPSPHPPNFNPDAS